MQLPIPDAVKLSRAILHHLGFSQDESRSITDNLIAAEKAGKQAHGLTKLLVIKNVLANPYNEGKKYFKYINTNQDESLHYLSRSASHLYVDANYKTGFYVISRLLEEAIPLACKTSVFAVGIKNLGFSSGYIGAYAKKAADNGLIYIGFHNSSGGLHYVGSKEDPLGTNPITVGIPSESYPTITDTSMAVINWSDIEVAKQEGKQLVPGVAIDTEGRDTTDPQKVFAVKSIAGHKGTALAYAVELLAGALTGSRVGFSQHGGWGSFFMLVNPDYFVGMEALESAVTRSNESIKGLSVTTEVIVPGERSNVHRTHTERTGYIEISQRLYEQLLALSPESTA